MSCSAVASDVEFLPSSPCVFQMPGYLLSQLLFSGKVHILLDVII